MSTLAWGDLGSSLPGTVTEPTMSMAGTPHITLKDAAGFGLSYVAEILSTTQRTSQAGNEAGLIHLQQDAQLCYDIPITAASMSYTNARIHTTTRKAECRPQHCTARWFDSNVIMTIL